MLLSEPAAALPQRSPSPELGHQQPTNAEEIPLFKSNAVTAAVQQCSLQDLSLKRTTLGPRMQFQLGFQLEIATDSQIRTGKWNLKDARLESAGDNGFTVYFSWDTEGKTTKNATRKRPSPQQTAKTPIASLRPKELRKGSQSLKQVSTQLLLQVSIIYTYWQRLRMKLVMKNTRLRASSRNGVERSSYGGKAASRVGSQKT